MAAPHVAGAAALAAALRPAGRPRASRRRCWTASTGRSRWPATRSAAGGSTPPPPSRLAGGLRRRTAPGRPRRPSARRRRRAAVLAPAAEPRGISRAAGSASGAGRQARRDALASGSRADADVPLRLERKRCATRALQLARAPARAAAARRRAGRAGWSARACGPSASRAGTWRVTLATAAGSARAALPRPLAIPVVSPGAIRERS